MLKTRQMEAFNDGIINILEACDGVISKNLAENIHFGNRTYGVKRFFDAKASGNTIERLIAVPFNDLIDRSNLIELREFRTGITYLYEIVMLQPKYDTSPPSVYLTLKRTEIQYDDNRTV